jgi:hypothetical protein
LALAKWREMDLRDKELLKKVAEAFEKESDTRVVKLPSPESGCVKQSSMNVLFLGKVL